MCKLFTRLVKYSIGVPLIFWIEKRINLSSNDARLFTTIMGVENKLQSHIALALNYFRIQHVVSAGTNFLAKYEYIASEIVYWFSLWNIQSVGFAIFISVRPITITYIIGKHEYIYFKSTTIIHSTLTLKIFCTFHTPRLRLLYFFIALYII